MKGSLIIYTMEPSLCIAQDLWFNMYLTITETLRNTSKHKERHDLMGVGGICVHCVARIKEYKERLAMEIISD